MSVEIKNQPKRNLAQFLIQLAVGFAITFALVVGVTKVYPAQPPRPIDFLALALALIFAIAGVRMLVLSFDRKQLGESLAVEGEGTPREAGSARWEAAGLLSGATLLAAPVLGRPADADSPLWLLTAVVAAMLVSVVYVVLILRGKDEYIRRQISENSLWVFMIGQGALLVYAPAERLGLVAPLTAWDALIWWTVLAMVAPLLRAMAKPKSAA